MLHSKVSRRLFLRLSAVVAGGALAACAPTPAPTPTLAPTAAPKATVAPTAVPPTAVPPTAAPKATVAPTAVPPTAVPPTAAPKAAAYKESPMLAELVKAGKLPPVEQRLPKEPVVVQWVDKPGKYGGTLRVGDARPTQLTEIKSYAQAGLFQYDMTGSTVLLDAAKSYKYSPDLKVLTIELREGHRWSDGAPFTVDDIMFWWEDVQSNKDLNANVGAMYRPGGKPMVVKKISPTVVEMTFAVPWPVLMDQLGRPHFSTDPVFFVPKHYLSKWHIKYNDKADDLAKEEKFEDWKAAFRRKMNPGNGDFAVGKPTIWAWIPTAMASDRIQLERNPYFFQVDPSGNQLPYIDRIDGVLVQNQEIMTLKASSGEFDISCLYLSLKDMPVFRASAERGRFHVALPQSHRPAMLHLMPNQTTKDAVIAELFRKKDYRIAMSIGIDRKRMNDALFFGLGIPFPATCHPGMSFFKPEWAKMYIEYDPAKANQLLDGLGLTKKDSEGYRLRPDGAGRISMLLEVGNPVGPKVEMAEMIAEDWKKIGLECVVQNLAEALYATRRNTYTELQIGTWHLDRAGLFGRSAALYYAYDGADNVWAGAWAQWFATGGKDGQEPPQQIKDHKALFDQYRQTLAGSPEFNRIGEQYYKFFVEEVPMIGTIGLEPWPMVVANRLQNVPEKDAWWGADLNFFGPYKPPQWWIEE